MPPREANAYRNALLSAGLKIQIQTATGGGDSRPTERGQEVRAKAMLFTREAGGCGQRYYFPLVPTSPLQKTCLFISMDPKHSRTVEHAHHSHEDNSAGQSRAYSVHEHVGVLREVR